MVKDYRADNKPEYDYWQKKRRWFSK